MGKKKEDKLHRIKGKPATPSNIARADSPSPPQKQFPTLREKLSAHSREKLDKCDLPSIPAFVDLDNQRSVEPTEANAYALALIKCTPKEIAILLNVELSYVLKKFDEAMKLGNQVSNAMLKRAMTKKALSGDTTMMVWLSKQHLGYREPKQDETQSNTINIVTSDMPQVLRDKVIEVKE